MANATPPDAELANDEVPGDPPAPPSAGVITPALEAQDRAQHRSDLNRTQAALRAQKKVTVKLFEDTFVGINGYQFFIQKGHKVQVPEQVADLLEEAGRI